MPAIGEYLGYAFVIGAGATAVLDGSAFLLNRLFKVPLSDYCLVGRWVTYMTRGKFRHDRIAASPPLRGERLIGWAVHYLTGIVFAGALLAIWGIEWVRHPTIGPALIVGIVSVTAPFFLMQPCMGAGFAASRTPNPAAARLRSLAMHGIFGLGLYIAGCAASLLDTLR